MQSRVRPTGRTVLADDVYTLHKDSFDYRRADGRWQALERLVLERGHGAAALLYNRERNTVVLVRQLRYPALVSGHPDALLEACAGLLDGDDPLTCIRREIEEETGYRPGRIEELFTAFLSPGIMTERVTFFCAEYQPDERAGDGGGLHHEGEDIEVVELAFPDALAAIENGGIVDAKTIILLQHAALKRLLRADAA